MEVFAILLIIILFHIQTYIVLYKFAPLEYHASLKEIAKLEKQILKLETNINELDEDYDKSLKLVTRREKKLKELIKLRKYVKQFEVEDEEDAE